MTTILPTTRSIPPVADESGADAAGLDDWRGLPAAQQPEWPDSGGLDQVTAELASYPPLVFAGECDELKGRLAAAARGEAFLLQGGDCAETFADATADRIRLKLKTMLQMAVVLTYGASLPVIKVGRMAGQYSKPRSRPTETRAGLELPAYRGDAVNDYAFDAAVRTPDPRRLLRAYHTSSMTLNLIRAFTKGGYADLRHVHEWNRGFVTNAANARYEALAHDIDKAMRFMAACGGDFDALRTVDFYSSHEALLLDYERALTRIDSRTGRPYNVSAHLLWIGERTRQLDGAHVDLMSRVRNPIAVKLGPSTTPADVLMLIDRLDPDREPGRLTFIVRMGSGQVRTALPPLVEAVSQTGATVLWVCDPMHGNTFESASGYKTRRFDDVMAEVRGFFEVHHGLGTVPGGLHIELTGDDVTECLGGAEQIDDAALATRYETLVRPAAEPPAVARDGLPRGRDAGRAVTGGAGPMPVDLRSDTVTRPTAGMRQAMAEADVGDDVYAEDPTVNQLESEVAERLGHEAGLFTPTGSMANMLGVRLLVQAGQELLCDSLAHVVRAELGGHAALAQVTTRTWSAPRGQLDAQVALAMATPDAGPHLVSTAAFAVENTHNFGGGTVQPIEQLRALREGATALGIRIHLDGARLWNAHVATGVPLAEYGACADTVSVCLSKGLGAPIGSVLVSSAERVAQARIWRKRYGGGMRQVGILAAAGQYALAHHVHRLGADHRRARKLAEALAAIRPGLVDPDAVETNIVVVRLAGTALKAPELAESARAQGVLISVLGPQVMRLVTHLDISDDDIERAVAVLVPLLAP